MAVPRSSVPTVGYGRLAVLLDGSATPKATCLAWCRSTGFTTIDSILYFSELRELAPIPLEALITDLPAARRTDLIRTTQEYVRALALTESESRKVRGTLTRLLGDSALDLAPPLRERIGHGAGHEIIEHQIDAISTALRCSGMDLKLLDESQPGSDSTGVLASMLPAAETHLIAHDARSTWPSLTESASPNIQAHYFRDGDNLLEVMDVNTMGIEHATGVDLLYFNGKYRSFVGVQYKASDPDRSSLASIDDRLTSQLLRMAEFDALSRESSHSNEYRALTATTFVKFAHTSSSAIHTSGLVDGPYIPATYLQSLYTSGELVGPRGGRTITYDNIKRWMPKSVFAELVRYGWAGSTGVTDAFLRQWIAEATQQKRSVIAAVHRRRLPREASNQV